MRHSIPATILLVILAVTSIELTAQTDTKQANKITDSFAIVEGHRMHYQTGGSGTATVVFESGHRSTLRDWDLIFPDVAKFAKVLRYDREGYGLSEPGTSPTSFKQIATRLHTLLHELNVPPPYILVGHSLGGVLIRAYAFLYPGEVSGLVFVDPFNEYSVDGMSKEQVTDMIKKYEPEMKKSGATALAEFDIANREFLNGFPEITSYGSLPDVPIVLFAAGKNGVDNSEKKLQKLFTNKMQDHLSARFIDIPQSPHYVQLYDPLLVIASIIDVAYPNPALVLRKTLLDKGIDSCIAQCKKIKASPQSQLLYDSYFNEKYLNDMGYEEINKEHVQNAIKLFALNVEFYPESWNVYDSLGEALMDAGDKTDAIKNYEKSLALNPANTNAVAMLKKLKEK